MGTRTLFGWRRVSDISTAVWLWTLVPPSVASVLTGHLAKMEGWSPPEALLAAIAAFAGALVITTLLYHLWKAIWSPYPPRHAELLQALADDLAEMKELATTPGAWERSDPVPFQVQHSREYEAVRKRVAQRTDQISYDKSTAATAKDFVHLCSMIVHDALHKDHSREHRQELDELSGAVFKSLHAGKSINRAKMPLPDWVKNADRAAAESARKRVERTP